MHPLRNNKSLWTNPEMDLSYINSVVTMLALANVDPDWLEVTKVFGDDFNYLSIGLMYRPSDTQPIVRIEFGVQDEGDKHAVGGMLAFWDKKRQQISGIESIIVDASECDISVFSDHLEKFVHFQCTASEAH